jgi:hypothetical protein
MTRRCEDKKCKYYGEDLVDRGYGYPVCKASGWSLNPVPMDLVYYGKYDKEIPRFMRI